MSKYFKIYGTNYELSAQVLADPNVDGNAIMQAFEEGF